MRKMAFPAAVFVIFVLCTSFHSTQLYNSPYYIVIDKSQYELSVFDSKGWLITYPVVFGSNDLRDKLYEGDRKTPEGTFTIVEKKVHSKWDRFMLNLYYYTFAQKSEAPVNLVHTRSPLVRDDDLPARYSRLRYPQSKFSGRNLF